MRMMMEGFGEEALEKKTYVKIDVEGKDSNAWAKCKEKLMTMVTDIMDFKINSYQDSTVRDELKRVSANLIEFANAKLEKPGIENQKLLTEIDLMLRTAAKTEAETRKINAEAEALELDNFTKRFRLAIGMAKALALMEKNEDGLLFCKDMEGLLGSFQANRLLEGGENH